MKEHTESGPEAGPWRPQLRRPKRREGKKSQVDEEAHSAARRTHHDSLPRGMGGGPSQARPAPRVPASPSQAPCHPFPDNKPHAASASICMSLQYHFLTAMPSLNVCPVRQRAETLPFHGATLKHPHKLTRAPHAQGIHGSPLRPPEPATPVCRYHPLCCLCTCLVSSPPDCRLCRAVPTAPAQGYRVTE